MKKETQLKAGFARVDITPPLGSFMPGYFIDRRAKAILDPLQINMVAFADDGGTAIVAEIDTEAISDCIAGRMRDAISAATGVDRRAIILHASHTHDGGFLDQVSGPNGEQDPHATQVDSLYAEMCIRRAADAAAMSIADLKPARLSVGRSTARRISFCRRYLMKDGSVKTNPGTGNPDVVKPVGTADDTVQVLRVDRDGAKPICIINFQTHPDTVGGETITADWPGLARGVFEAATAGEALCMVLNGTQGDVNHCNAIPLPGELNGLVRDFDAVDRGYDHAKHMANVLAASALSVWMKCAALEGGKISFAESVVRVPAQKAKDSDEKNLAWANEIWTLHEEGRDADISARYGWREMELTTEVARARRIIDMARHPDFHELPIAAIAIGEAVAFCGFPGEPFNDIGVEVRKASPFSLTMLACLTNGSRGYFPFSDSYAQGGYEAATSPFAPCVAGNLIEGATALLRSLAS